MQISKGLFYPQPDALCKRANHVFRMNTGKGRPTGMRVPLLNSHSVEHRKKKNVGFKTAAAAAPGGRIVCVRTSTSHRI